MKKLIITMIAVAFSLSAFSAGGIYKLDEHKKVGKTLITVWCVGDKVLVETNEGSITQLMEFWGEGANPMKCSEYKK